MSNEPVQNMQVSNQPEKTPQQNQAEGRKPDNSKIPMIIAGVLAVQMILAVVIGIVLFKNGYQNSKNRTAETIRKTAYDGVYGQVEKAYHVSNAVSISLENIHEQANLEVLQVDASYLYVTDEEDKERNQKIWYKVPGTGTFTVDMRMAEFITDQERQHVLVNVPAPAITQFEEDYANVKKLLYIDQDFWDIGQGSVGEGEEIARKILAKAHVQMMKRLELNQAYYMAAEESATIIISNMIRALNPDIQQLQVEVTFNGLEM